MKNQAAATLKTMSKKEVFAVYCRVCLGRVHNAVCAEMNKSWMIADILKARGQL